MEGVSAATAFEHDITIVTRNAKDFASLGVTIRDLDENVVTRKPRVFRYRREGASNFGKALSEVAENEQLVLPFFYCPLGWKTRFRK